MATRSRRSFRHTSTHTEVFIDNAFLRHPIPCDAGLYAEFTLVGDRDRPKLRRGTYLIGTTPSPGTGQAAEWLVVLTCHDPVPLAEAAATG